MVKSGVFVSSIWVEIGLLTESALVEVHIEVLSQKVLRHGLRIAVHVRTPLEIALFRTVEFPERQNMGPDLPIWRICTGLRWLGSPWIFFWSSSLFWNHWVGRRSIDIWSFGN